MDKHAINTLENILNQTSTTMQAIKALEAAEKQKVACEYAAEIALINGDESTAEMLLQQSAVISDSAYKLWDSVDQDYSSAYKQFCNEWYGDIDAELWSMDLYNEVSSTLETIETAVKHFDGEF